MAVLDLNLLPTVNDKTQVKPYLEVASGKLSTFIDEVAHSDHPLKNPALLRPKLRL